MRIETKTITPATAKTLISTYDETPARFMSSHEFSTLWGQEKRKPRRQRSIDRDALICVTDTGQLVEGISVLVRIIEGRRPHEVSVCIVSDAELVEDIAWDLDLELKLVGFPKILNTRDEEGGDSLEP